jgi:uncharacterized cupredoxin-like copper-binding protein
MIGLAIVAVLFIAFALSVSFLAPRRWPDFPGRAGMSVFVIASLALFVAMLSAVIVFGKEAPEAEAKGQASPEPHGSSSHKQTIRVTEDEWSVKLPSTGELREGSYRFVVHNAGKIPHNLVVEGPNTQGDKTTLIAPGGNATLTADLKTGNYTLYCDVPGHRQLGMVAKISVG